MDATSTSGEVTNYEYVQQPQVDPYLNPMVLESVQSATIGSAAVKYTSEPTQENTQEAGGADPTASTTVVAETAAVTTTSIEIPTETITNTTEQSSEETPTKSNELCRDFMNGLCGRTGCKYKHDPATRNTSEQTHAPICKDYQNGKCHRPNCKFLHLTKEQSEEFEKTGIMPEMKVTVNPKPCRDFANGMCKRGNTCKFSHGPVGLQGKRPFSALLGTTIMPNGTPRQVNEELKAKLLDLRKQVLELTSLNDSLYNENQKFRNQFSGTNGLGKMSLLPKPYASNGY